jgi:hypothetical protein
MFTGTPNGGNDGTTPGYVKDITIDNATVTGDHWTAVFWGNSYGELVYENVTVKNTSVTGNCNTSIFLGGTIIEGAGCIDNILFKNCKVENCSVVANGKDGQDPTGASVFCGRTYGKTSLTFDGCNVDSATKVENKNGLVGGMYGYTTWYGTGFVSTGASDEIVDWTGVELAAVVGDNVYTSLVEAASAAKAGDTITILEKVDLPALEFRLPANSTLVVNADISIKTLSAVDGCVISIKEDKTMTLKNFSFGSKDAAGAEYEIRGGTVVANYGFFQHGKYDLYSNFETGYMYYSYGSDITVYGTFHSRGSGDGLDYVRGKLTIANGGKSIHDKSLWVGQPASWGAMNASLIIEDGGYVQVNSLSVYDGSTLTYYNDDNLKYNSVSGTDFIQKN